MPLVTTDEGIRDILTRYRHIAVVGLSDDAMRPSNDVAEYLIRQGYDIVGVNPNLAGREVLGVPVYASLADLPAPPEIVDVFRRSEFVPEVADAAIVVGARVLWTQLGVQHDDAARRASEAGLIVVQNHCTAADHRRLGLGRWGV